MTTYRVRYEIDEAGYWVATAPDVQGCHTQGRSLETARARIREALAVCVDDAEDADLEEVYLLPDKVARAAARKARTARERAETAQGEAQALLRDAVARLLDLNLSHRDAAAVLGISHQRVAQLAQKADGPSPKGKRKRA